ncbi:hypothetical protein MLD38_040833 [Melastoma candidum]|nr:hypothetical protein MLD38_040833 [Melastoma candidum]
MEQRRAILREESWRNDGGWAAMLWSRRVAGSRRVRAVAIGVHDLAIHSPSFVGHFMEEGLATEGSSLEDIGPSPCRVQRLNALHSLGPVEAAGSTSCAGYGEDAEVLELDRSEGREREIPGRGVSGEGGGLIAVPLVAPSLLPLIRGRLPFIRLAVAPSSRRRRRLSQLSGEEVGRWCKWEVLLRKP